MIERQGQLTGGHTVGLVKDGNLVAYTLCCANILILPRTTSMPRSSDALSSSMPSLTESPSILRARAMTHVVLPIPGEPVRIMCGMLPSLAMDRRRCTASSFPTTSPPHHSASAACIFSPWERASEPVEKERRGAHATRSNGLDMARITGTSYQLSPDCEFHDLRCAQWCAGGSQFHTRERRATPSKLTAKDVEMQVASMHATPHC